MIELVIELEAISNYVLSAATYFNYLAELR